MMLTIRYNRGLYVVRPVAQGKEDRNMRWIFSAEEQAAEFIRGYFLNPFAALFAYHRSIA